MATARSFCIPVNGADALGRALAAARADVSSPSGGIVFVAGPLTQELAPIAERVRVAWRGVPALVVPAAGVLSERAEIEGSAAVSGVLWSGGKASPLVLPDAAPAAALRELLAGSVGSSAATVLLFPRSDFSPDMLDGLSAAAPRATVLGAGTVGGAALAISATGEILRGRAVGLVLSGVAPPIVDASAACRLLTPLKRIDETAGGLVLRIEGAPALDVLSSCAPEVRGAAPPVPPASPQPREGGAPRRAGGEGAQVMVFAALADAEGDRFVVRPVRGIDPTRRGVMIGVEAKPGGRLAFGVRDAAAAKNGLEASAKALAQQSLGAAPRFALYLTCAGRGQGLHGAPEVEARVLRARFGDLPIAGMHSAFEIVPWGPGAARIALYTGVLALFRAPS